MTTELLAELELPAEQIRAIRLVAGRIALAEGLDDEAAEDVKLAVGEAVNRLAAGDAAARLRVRFQRHKDALRVEFPGFPAPPRAIDAGRAAPTGATGDDDFGWLILDAVVPGLGLAGDTLHLTWPLPRTAAARG